MVTENDIVSRYAICGELASGGMATIHIGRPIGVAPGSARPVAIKRLMKSYASNVEFVTMFLDEMWLAARVRHVNIVATLDVISQDGDLSLIMEYVPGETLGRLLRVVREQQQYVPVPIVAGILCGVLEGLHAAHEARDEHGNALEIVHRDVSPQNVIVGVDGIPRLLDFGVAKASVRLQLTRAGQLKGKLAYMSPEQIERQEVSRLSDVYAAGVVLWEALTAKRLFEADNEGALLHRVLQGPALGPRDVRPAVPEELQAIAMRALARNPHDRFPSARAMAHAIELTGPIARAAAIGEWVTAVAQKSLDARARLVADFLHGPAALSASTAPRAPASDPSLSGTPPSTSRPSSVTSASSLSRPSTSSVLRSPVRSLDGPASSPASSKRVADKHVLVIDDSEFILEQTRRVLESAGYRVTTTTQTVGAARYLVDCDLAVIDFHMPGLDGGKVIESLRAACAASGRTCLFYLYTADAAIGRDYAQLGFDGSFTAKGDDAALVRQVRGALRVLQMRAMRK